MSSIETAWLRLVDELATRAPGTRVALRPPAPGVDVVAERLGVELTGEVRDWFGLHGGAAPFFDGQVLPFNTVLSLLDAVEATLLTRSIWWRHDQHVDRAAAERQPAGTTAHTWLANYVYIGQDGTGGGIFVDLRPGPLQGCVRFWDKVEADLGQLAATSITDLLAAVHSAISAEGTDVGGWTPFVDNEVIDWTPSDT
jgi:cell wall assembly regulator SMI1